MNQSKLDKAFAQTRSELHKGLADLTAELARHRADLITCMFVAWAATVIPLAGLMIALTRR